MSLRDQTLDQEVSLVGLASTRLCCFLLWAFVGRLLRVFDPEASNVLRYNKASQILRTTTIRTQQEETLREDQTFTFGPLLNCETEIFMWKIFDSIHVDRMSHRV